MKVDVRCGRGRRRGRCRGFCKREEVGGAKEPGASEQVSGRSSAEPVRSPLPPVNAPADAGKASRLIIYLRCSPSAPGARFGPPGSPPALRVTLGAGFALDVTPRLRRPAVLDRGNESRHKSLSHKDSCRRGDAAAIPSGHRARRPTRAARGSRDERIEGDPA